MVGDRVTSLMVQAAVRGFDFTTAETRSRRWWLKLKLILDRIEDENTESVYRLQHAQHTRVLSYDVDQSVFDHHWKGANKLLQQIYGINFPWHKAASAYDKPEIDGLLAEWARHFGDPKDPAVQARYRKVAEAMRRRTASSSGAMFSEQRKLQNMVRHVMGSRRKKGKT